MIVLCSPNKYYTVILWNALHDRHSLYPWADTGIEVFTETCSPEQPVLTLHQMIVPRHISSLYSLAVPWLQLQPQDPHPSPHWLMVPSSLCFPLCLSKLPRGALMSFQDTPASRRSVDHLKNPICINVWAVAIRKRLATFSGHAHPIKETAGDRALSRSRVMMDELSLLFWEYFLFHHANSCISTWPETRQMTTAAQAVWLMNIILQFPFKWRLEIKYLVLLEPILLSFCFLFQKSLFLKVGFVSQLQAWNYDFSRLAG